MASNLLEIFFSKSKKITNKKEPQLFKTAAPPPKPKMELGPVSNISSKSKKNSTKKSDEPEHTFMTQFKHSPSKSKLDSIPSKGVLPYIESKGKTGGEAIEKAISIAAKTHNVLPHHLRVVAHHNMSDPEERATHERLTNPPEWDAKDYENIDTMLAMLKRRGIKLKNAD